MKQVLFGVSGHFLENARKEWPEIWHVNVCWLPSELIKFWSWSVDFPSSGAILTFVNCDKSVWYKNKFFDVSSEFHSLVNSGLTVGSLVKWLPIIVVHTCKLWHNLSGLYLADWKWLHPDLIAFNTLCPVQFYIHWCVALRWTHWGSYFEKINLSLPWKLIFSKSYQSW